MKNASASQDGFVNVMRNSMKNTFFQVWRNVFRVEVKSGEVSEKLSFETWKCFSVENFGL